MDICLGCPGPTLFWAEAGRVTGAVDLPNLSLSARAVRISLAGLHSHAANTKAPGRVPFALTSKGSSLQPVLPASVSYGRKAKCPI